MEYIDLTHTFSAQMPVFPRDTASSLVQMASIEKEGYADHELKTGMHVGTHLDAPAHFIKNGKLISDFGPEKFFGEGVLIDARGRRTIDADLLLNYQQRFDLSVPSNSAEATSDRSGHLPLPRLHQDFGGQAGEKGTIALGFDWLGQKISGKGLF